MENLKSRWQLILGVLWLVTSVSLATWWIIFGFRQLDTLHSTHSPEQLRKQTMIIYEGTFLIGLLLLGGGALAYFILRERKQTELIRKFFATFTHEVKTSLASLRLQAESLEEDLKDAPQYWPLTQRLVKDTVKLELQLENSLFLAKADRGTLFIESISLKRLMESLQMYWPEMRVKVGREVTLLGDRRVLECIFKNVLQNSFLHGKASSVTIEAVQAEVGKVQVSLQDNGTGFLGEVKNLGEMFVRHSSKSGTGLGLYLVQNLTERLGGVAHWNTISSAGFRVDLILPGSLHD